MLMAYAEQDDEGQALVGTFRAALASLGWVDGRNIHIDVRWAPASANAEVRLQFAKELIAAQAQKPNGSLVVMPDTFTTANRAKITALALQYQLPATYPFHYFSKAGGLLSYGNDTNDSYARAAVYGDRILKGDTPSELPVQAPVKFQLIVNLKTAKALGLTLPETFLMRADKVIE
jgi:putative ABC transport system substrate-binding protein